MFSLLICFKGLNPRSSYVRRQVSHSPASGLASIASVTGVIVSSGFFAAGQAGSVVPRATPPPGAFARSCCCCVERCCDTARPANKKITANVICLIVAGLYTRFRSEVLRRDVKGQRSHVERQMDLTKRPDDRLTEWRVSRTNLPRLVGLLPNGNSANFANRWEVYWV